MLKRLTIFVAAPLLLSSLSGCMYYAEYADKRADTGIKEQYKALLEAHAQCLKANQNSYERCPQPPVPNNNNVNISR